MLVKTLFHNNDIEKLFIINFIAANNESTSAL